MDALIDRYSNTMVAAVAEPSAGSAKRGLAIATAQRVLDIWGVRDPELRTLAANHLVDRLSRDPRLEGFLKRSSTPTRGALREFALRIARETHNALCGLLCESEEPVLWSGCAPLAARVRLSLLQQANASHLGGSWTRDPCPMESASMMPPQPLGDLFSPRTRSVLSLTRAWATRILAVVATPFVSRA